MNQLTIKDQTFTTTLLASLLNVSRREIHEIFKNPNNNIKPKKVEYGKVGKFIFTWDDLGRFKAILGNKKQIKHKVKTVSNAKGGVGKSAVATNLALEATYKGYKTLAIDLDPQGQFTYNLGLADPPESTFKDIVGNDGRIIGNGLKDIIVNITPLLDLVPSDISLNGLELILKNKMVGSEKVVSQALEGVVDDYDLVIIDTNPYVSLTFINALIAAQQVIIPALTDFNSHMGLEYMFTIFDDLFPGENLRPNIKIVPNAYDVRDNISKESMEILRENYTQFLTETKIGVSTSIRQANKLQQSLRQYQKSSRATMEFSELAEELLQ